MKVNLFSQRSLHVFHLLLPFLCHEVAANTEIINFSSSRGRSVDLPWDVVGNWSKLHPSENEQRWTLEPAVLHTPLHQVCEQDGSSDQPPFSCPHALWVFLDLDDQRWASYSTFTLRLSWPASTPADFTMALYSPQDLVAHLSRSEAERSRHAAHTSAPPSSSPSSTLTPHSPTTRSRYACIRAVDAAVPVLSSSLRSPPLVPPWPRVPTPPPGSADMPAHAPSHVAAGAIVGQGRREGVSFVVILEPLHLGVLPASLLPTIGFLIPVVLGAALSVSRVTAYLEPVVRQARADTDSNTRFTQTKKER